MLDKAYEIHFKNEQALLHQEEQSLINSIISHNDTKSKKGKEGDKEKDREHRQDEYSLANNQSSRDNYTGLVNHDRITIEKGY